MFIWIEEQFDAILIAKASLESLRTYHFQLDEELKQKYLK